MKRPLSTIAVASVSLLAGLNSLAVAQQWETPPRDWNSATPYQPEPATDHFKCTVTKVLPGQVLMVKDEQTKSFRYLELTPTTSLKAKKRAEFGGRKKLEFEDLAAGQRIKVTHLIATGEILKVLVLDKVSGS